MDNLSELLFDGEEDICGLRDVLDLEEVETLLDGNEAAIQELHRELTRELFGRTLSAGTRESYVLRDVVGVSGFEVMYEKAHGGLPRARRSFRQLTRMNVGSFDRLLNLLPQL